MNFHDFRNWFDGFVENIEGAPTEAQWQRLLARMAEVTETAPTPVIVQQQAPPPEPKKPATEKAWRAQFIAALIEKGYDKESAEESLEDVMPIDLGRDPRQAAASVAVN